MTLKTTWANGEQFNASDANDVATAVNAAYVKPGTGIPATDLASAVQTSLGKADSAVQSVSSTSISDATTTGKSLLTTTDASTARTTLGVAYGSTAGTVCEGNDSRLSPSSTSITDATTTGKALLTTTDASTARTTLGVAYGTTSTTVCVGNDSRLSDTRNVANTNTVTVKDANLTVQDDSDTTKQLQLQLSGITTGTTRTLTVPDASTTIVGTDTTQTLTNKRITPRIGTTASSATPAIDVGLYDQFNITALAAAITSMTSGLSGTPTDGQKLLIRIKDNGTARAITWGASFVASGAAALPTTTAVSKTHLVGFIYDSTAAKWVCVAADSAGY